MGEYTCFRGAVNGQSIEVASCGPMCLFHAGIAVDPVS
jgi:hypothetical protein